MTAPSRTRTDATGRRRCTLVLVHGAFHTSWCWTEVVAGLTERGVAAVAPDLPGHGDDRAPLGALRDDADRMAAIANGIDGPVALIGHSYGGAVVGQAVADCTNVAACVFLAGFLLRTGESIATAVHGSAAEPSAPLELLSVADDVAVVASRSARDAFYADCAAPAADAAIEHLSPQRLSALTEPATSDGWRHLPSGYVVCSDDRAFAPHSQGHLALRADRFWVLPAGHSPFVSRPAKLADLLVEVVAELTAPMGSEIG